MQLKFVQMKVNAPIQKEIHSRMLCAKFSCIGPVVLKDKSFIII